MPTDLSILIVNWNTKDLLVSCIESVLSTVKTVSFELIVVDNASSDGSVEVIRERFPHVRVLANSDNRGFAAASNQAIEVATGRYLLLLNSDTVVLGDCLDRIVEFADRHPRVGAVGCRVLNEDRSIQPSCMTFPDPLNLAILAMRLHLWRPRSKLLGRQHMTWWSYDEVRDVEYVKGCFLLARWEAVQEVGVLDERFYMFCEEADWCCRMHKAGWRVVFSPVGEIIHYGGASTIQVKHDMILQSWGSMLRFVRKHQSYPSYLACSLIAAKFFGIRACWCAMLGLVRPRRRSELFARAGAYGGGLRALIFRGPTGLCAHPKTARPPG